MAATIKIPINLNLVGNFCDTRRKNNGGCIHISRHAPSLFGDHHHHLHGGSKGGRVHELLSIKAVSSSSSSKGIGAGVNGIRVNGVISVDPNHHEVSSSSSSSTTYMGIKRSQLLNDEDPAQGYMLGDFVEKRFVYRQTFIIRSYEIGPDKTATMETLMNLLQETALNHVTSSGLAGNGFGATREMSIRKLIWVVTRVHVQVKKYSSWGDVVEIDTWVDAAGKNGMRRDWIIRDHSTQKIITRATSTWVIMNRETRKLSKIPEQVRQEVFPFYLHRYALESGEDDSDKINKLTDETADIVRSGLAPRWSDMDANQHVNNVKYIGWILESVPIKVLEEYNLTSMTLEYRRECRQANVLESLTSMKMAGSSSCNSRAADIESTHLLRMQDDNAEIVRARTEWQLKHTSSVDSMV